MEKVVVALCFMALLICCETGKIEPFQNTGITDLKTNEQGEAFWEHGLPFKPNQFEIKVIDRTTNQKTKSDCGTWGFTQLFVRIDSAACHQITVIWSASL